MLFGFVLKFCTFKFEFEVNQLCINVFCVGFFQFRVHQLAELRAQAPEISMFGGSETIPGQEIAQGIRI